MSIPDKEELLTKINSAIDIVRPYLKADGGDIEVVELTDDMRVMVRLTGACNGCPFSMQTLKAGVEQVVRKEVPQIVELIAV